MLNWMISATACCQQQHQLLLLAQLTQQQLPEIYLVACVMYLLGVVRLVAMLAAAAAAHPTRLGSMGRSRSEPFSAVSFSAALFVMQALAAMWQQLLLHTPPDLAAQTLQEVQKRLQAQQQGKGAALVPAGTQSAAAAVEAGGGSSSTAAAAGGDEGAGEALLYL
jgi:hypothetical protein